MRPNRLKPNGCARRWSGSAASSRSKHGIQADCFAPFDDGAWQTQGAGDLTQGAIGTTLLTFALPTLASSILQSLNGTINAIWVGRLLGENALAATSNANMVMFLLSRSCSASAWPRPSSSARRGAEGCDEARRVFGTAMGSFLLVSIAIALPAGFLAPEILNLLATPADAAPLALAYLRVIFLAMPALLLLTLLMMALRGAGDSLTPLWFMIVAVVLDSGLNPFFIRGIGPIPALGIAGSALSTLVGNYVALIGLLDLPLRKTFRCGFAGANCAFCCPTGDPKTLFVKGLPMGIQMIVISLSALALVGLVNREGVDTAAAFGVAMQLWTYVQMPAMALGAAVSAMAAQNIGAGHWDRVGQVTARRDRPVALITGGLIVAADPRRPGGARPVHGPTARRCRSPATSICSRPGTSCCSA